METAGIIIITVGSVLFGISTTLAWFKWRAMDAREKQRRAAIDKMDRDMVAALRQISSGISGVASAVEMSGQLRRERTEQKISRR
jgi:uncharacterized membrane protein